MSACLNMLICSLGSWEGIARLEGSWEGIARHLVHVDVNGMLWVDTM